MADRLSESALQAIVDGVATKLQATKEPASQATQSEASGGKLKVRSGEVSGAEDSYRQADECSKKREREEKVLPPHG